LTNNKKDVDEVFKSLKILSRKYQIIVTYPNFDPGYKYIITKINNLKKTTPNVKVIKHLGRKNYHSLLYYIGKNKKGFCMGNSSSGIKEAVVFDCPTINIGDRQKSRLKPNNVIDVEANNKKIIRAINTKIKGKGKIKNPYKINNSFNKLPEDIFKKFFNKDFKLKKCTV
jgi:UDP-N-acetylglucosamine 2-epimerase